MDKLELMTILVQQLTKEYEGRITFLLHATTHVIHAYNKGGEIARLELVHGSQGSQFISLTNPSMRLDNHNIKIDPQCLLMMSEH